jgi:hypothetical protein
MSSSGQHLLSRDRELFADPHICRGITFAEPPQLRYPTNILGAEDSQAPVEPILKLAA